MKKAISLLLTFCLATLMFVVVPVVYSLNNNTTAYAATDDNSEYDLNWEEQDLTAYADRVTDEPVEAETPMAAIIVISFAAVACIGLGATYAVITVRRKKK